MAIPSYKAFISYKHSQTGRMHAKALESALKDHARPLFQRPVYLFRDEKHMVPHQDLPGTIQQGLNRSEYLIYIAEKAASESTWCRKELNQWLNALDRGQKFIVVHVDDTIAFEPDNKHINWDSTNAIPPINHELELPYYFDLRWGASEADIMAQHKRYESVINEICALFYDCSPADMRKKARQVKRYNRLIINTALITLFLLTIGLTSSGWLALANTQKAHLAENDYQQKKIQADSSRHRLIREQQAALQATSKAKRAKANADSLTEVAFQQKREADYTLSQFETSFSNSLSTKSYTYLDNDSRVALLLLAEAQRYQSTVSYDTLIPYLSLNFPNISSSNEFKKSPNTKDFAFRANWDSHGKINSGPNIWNPEKEDLISFKSNCCLSYSFSDDNRKFIFYTKLNERQNTVKLNIYDLLNSTHQTIDNCYFHEKSGVFSPDGRTLVYIIKEDLGDGFSYTLNIKDYSNDVTQTFSQLSTDLRWAYSPDLNRIAFVQQDSSTINSVRLVVWNLEQQMIEWEDLYLYEENQDEIKTFLFLNDGSEIAYFTKNGKQAELNYKIHSFEHGEILQLPLDKAHHMHLAPLSSNITYISDGDNPTINLWDFTNNTSTRIASLSGIVRGGDRSITTITSWDTLNLRHKPKTTYGEPSPLINHYRFDINSQGNFIAFQTNLDMELGKSDLYIYDVAAKSIIKHFKGITIPINASNAINFSFSTEGTKIIFSEESDDSFLEKLTVFDLLTQKTHVFNNAIKGTYQFFNKNDYLIYGSRKTSREKASTLHIVNFAEDTEQTFELPGRVPSKYEFNKTEDKVALSISRKNKSDLIIWDAQLQDTIQFSNLNWHSYAFNSDWEKIILLKNAGLEASVCYVSNKMEIRKIKHNNPIENYGFLYNDQYLYTTSRDAFDTDDLLKISIILPQNQLLNYYSEYFSGFSPEEQIEFLLLYTPDN